MAPSCLDPRVVARAVYTAPSPPPGTTARVPRADAEPCAELIVEALGRGERHGHGDINDTCSKVMVTEPRRGRVERAGPRTALNAPALTAQAETRATIQICRPPSNDPLTHPVIDTRPPDSSRAPVYRPPAAPTTAFTIPRSGGRASTIDKLTARGSLLGFRGATAELGDERNVLDLRRHRVREDDTAGYTASLDQINRHVATAAAPHRRPAIPSRAGSPTHM